MLYACYIFCCSPVTNIAVFLVTGYNCPTAGPSSPPARKPPTPSAPRCTFRPHPKSTPPCPSQPCQTAKGSRFSSIDSPPLPAPILCRSTKKQVPTRKCLISSLAEKKGLTPRQHQSFVYFLLKHIILVVAYLQTKTPNKPPPEIQSSPADNQTLPASHRNP